MKTVHINSFTYGLTLLRGLELSVDDDARVADVLAALAAGSQVGFDPEEVMVLRDGKKIEPGEAVADGDRLVVMHTLVGG